MKTLRERILKWRPFSYRFTASTTGLDYLKRVESKIVSDGGQVRYLSAKELWFKHKYGDITRKWPFLKGLHSFGQIEGSVRLRNDEEYDIEINLLFNRVVFFFFSSFFLILAVVSSIQARRITNIGLFLVAVILAMLFLSIPNSQEIIGLKKFFNSLKD